MCASIDIAFGYCCLSLTLESNNQKIYLFFCEVVYAVPLGTTHAMCDMWVHTYVYII